ncbi:MAG TPA: RimK-like protein [Bradyrhizobium sp.]|uniref:ATP-grasp domain-containing protein n=1 Tax=Bradyrhizobium sp. TaxID=376 RepID=UPI002B478C16|nr:RimK-like protein [Bradyrhizobium sp.]HKO73324.1 RimK-like protein [Bradyrhizobium sp.]
MLNSPRIFLDAVSKYCVTHGIQIEIRAAGWLVVMRRGTKQHLAFGYDLGLNSSVAHRIANDKAATAEVLHALGIPCVPHTVFFSPQMNEVMPPQASWEAMIAILRANPSGVVIKPNEGTSGNSVFRVSNGPELELAAHRIFASSPSLAMSPWLDIEDEVRVVLLDDRPLLVYSKSRPTILGDGVRSVLELALAGMPYEMRSTVFSDMIYNLDSATLNSIPPPGERQLLSWRHNLDKGAQPVLLGEGKVRDDCVELAAQAANAIGIRFSSIDVVNVNGAWKILEINSGVMMEALGRLHPELVYAAYSAALDKVFD